jgi:predicted kinase
MGLLVLLKGQPGCGKSTLGKSLASNLRVPLIIKDDARDYLHHGSLTDAHPSIDWNSLSYDIMFNYLETQLSVGLSAIVDSPLARRELFDRAAALAKKYNAEIALIELYASDQQEWSRRLSERGKSDVNTERAHKPGSIEDVHAIIKRNGGSESWSNGVTVPCHVILDSCGYSVDGMTEKVIGELQKAGLIETQCTK